MAYLLHAPRTRPHFIAYAVKDLPALAPLIARTLFGLPLLTWTVRSEDDRRRAAARPTRSFSRAGGREARTPRYARELHR